MIFMIFDISAISDEFGDNFEVSLSFFRQFNNFSQTRTAEKTKCNLSFAFK